jgi:site-specific recombinase XerC
MESLDGRAPAPIAPDELRRLGAFLNRLRERGRADKTLASYQFDHQALARWFVETNGRVFDLKELSGIDSADYVAFLTRVHKPATVARRLIFLRAYATEAHKRGEITTELLERIEGLRPPRTQHLAPRGITSAEARAALRRADLQARLGIAPSSICSCRPASASASSPAASAGTLS